MNTVFDIPADLDTPTSVYLKLRPLGPRFLLESVEQGDQVGRFSFIGFGPGLEVTSDGWAIHAGSTSIETDGTAVGLMDGLRKALATAPSPGPLSSAIPFHGGLVGAISFDLAHRLVGSPPPSSDRPEIRLYGPPSLIVFDHLSRRAALLHDGPEADRLDLRREVIGLLGGGVPVSPGGGGLGPPSGSMGVPDAKHSRKYAALAFAKLTPIIGCLLPRAVEFGVDRSRRHERRRRRTVDADVGGSGPCSSGTPARTSSALPCVHPCRGGRVGRPT